MISRSARAKLLALLAGPLLLSSCADMEGATPRLTPLELQAIQSREFEVSRETAFNAVMTVFQDLGYILQTADLPSGFITASSPTRNKTNFVELLDGANASGDTAVTATFLPLPNGLTRVRLNFVNRRTISSPQGQSSREDRPVLDPAIYQNAWEKIDEALFMLTALSDLSRPAGTAPVTPRPPS
ncbi:MAG: hypothetical protein ACXIT4_09600 [Erythrobacter sp.]